MSKEQALIMDLNSIKKDLSIVSGQIKQAHDELKQVKAAIVTAREELVGVQKLHEPVLTTLAERKQTLTDNITALLGEIAGLEHQKSDQARSLRDAEAKSLAQITSAKDALATIHAVYLGLSKSLPPLRQDLVNMETARERKQKELDDMDLVLAGNKELEAKRDVLLQDIATLDSQFKEKDNIFTGTKKLYDELMVYEQELYTLMDENELMNTRLKPEYLEAFGKYANLNTPYDKAKTDEATGLQE